MDKDSKQQKEILLIKNSRWIKGLIAKKKKKSKPDKVELFDNSEAIKEKIDDLAT